MILFGISPPKDGYNYHTELFLQDDFISQASSSGSIGALGWMSSGTISNIASEDDMLGLLRLDTGAVSATQARITLLGASVGTINPAYPVTVTWVARLNTNDSDTTVRLGMGNNNSSDPPANGIYFEKLAADTNWFCVTRASSSQTRTNSGVATSTSFVTCSYTVRTSQVVFSINNQIVATNTATIPTAMISPLAWMINAAAASKTLDVDYFELYTSGLTRT